VEAYGKSATAAGSALVARLKERSQLTSSGLLTLSTRFSVAADLYIERLEEKVKADKYSPGTLYTYQLHLKNNVLPRIGEICLGEATPPLMDKVVTAIRDEVGAVSAKTCKTVISGVFSLAVRQGAIQANPVRELESLDAAPLKAPRAFTEDELAKWFAMVSQDERAVRADVPDLSIFLLGTGVRISESLAVLWNEVDFASNEVHVNCQINRVKGKGLVRRRTKSRAGQRILTLPEWAMDMLRRRFSADFSLDQPVFADAIGGFRDPNNVRKSLRLARQPIGSDRRRELGKLLAKARRNAGLTQVEAVKRLDCPKNRISLIETGRVRVDVSEAQTLAHAYKLSSASRKALLKLVEEAAVPSIADELDWVTSHNFRKTTATLLDEAGQTPRQVADQLGQSRPSMTQDVYFGRRARNPEAASALAKAMPTGVTGQKHGVKHGQEGSGS
ncbi:helix-turn-helix domain-containing protein, partial [Kribbella monticola]|uniref:helix-turn-helix domain-containing protein n=1 Tax=Kribbella monticola TaxID=2185285 RepID=UPI0013009C74